MPTLLRLVGWMSAASLRKFSTSEADESVVNRGSAAGRPAAPLELHDSEPVLLSPPVRVRLSESARPSPSVRVRLSESIRPSPRPSSLGVSIVFIDKLRISGTPVRDR